MSIVLAIIFGLLALNFYGLYMTGLKKRQNLGSYAVYLLLNDEIRVVHKARLLDFIRQQPGDALSTSAGSLIAIGRLADDLATNSNSALAAHQMIAQARMRA